MLTFKIANIFMKISASIQHLFIYFFCGSCTHLTWHLRCRFCGFSSNIKHGRRQVAAAPFLSKRLHHDLFGFPPTGVHVWGSVSSLPLCCHFFVTDSISASIFFILWLGRGAMQMLNGGSNANVKSRINKAGSALWLLCDGVLNLFSWLNLIS